MTEINTVSVGDMKVRVSGTGFPQILLHGYTTTGEFWREQGRRAVAFLASDQTESSVSWYFPGSAETSVGD